MSLAPEGSSPPPPGPAPCLRAFPPPGRRYRTQSVFETALQPNPNPNPSTCITDLSAEESERPPPLPAYYFFYGTLTEPDVLKGILDIEDEAVLRSAQITGYSLAKWGDYLALIDAKSGGGVVAGYAYLVQSEEAARKLEHYETKAYRVTASRIWMTDNSEPVEVLGRTFKYAGDSEALLQGRFDRKLWARQMTEKES